MDKMELEIFLSPIGRKRGKETVMGKNFLVTLLKGAWVGGTMTVPGVSGGTMAIIMGMYDDLISSVSSFFKNPKKHGLFLLAFSAGGVCGLILFARMMSVLLKDPVWGIPLGFFFVGAVAAGVPVLVRESKVKKINVKAIVCIIIGMILVMGIARIPQGSIAVGGDSGITGILMQFFCGIIIALALVLPGISASQMLYMFGIYDQIMNNVATFNFLPLIPIVLGLVAGILISTKIIERLINEFPRETYMVILGFVIASVYEIFPDLKELIQWRSVLLLVAGFVVITLISSREAKQTKES